MVAFRECRVKAGGISTRYLEAGERGRVPIILLHDGGFGGGAEYSWEAFFAPLAEKGYHVIAPDLVGFGGTDKVVRLGCPPFVPHVQHIRALCEVLDLESAHFIGNSFGGTVALRALAAGTPQWPARSVVSIGGTGGPWRNQEGMRDLLNYDGTQEGMRKLVGVLAGDFLDYEEYIARRHQNSLIPGHYQALAAPRLSAPWGKADRGEDDFPRGLSSTNIPILLINGVHDNTNQPDWAQQISHVCPMADIVNLDSRHSPNLDMPEAVLQEILPWIKQKG